MTPTVYDMSPDEIDTIINKNVPSLIQDLLKLRNTFNGQKNKELPKELKMSMFHIGKISKIWELRKDQIVRETLETKKQSVILEATEQTNKKTNKPTNKSRSNSGNDSDSDGSVSDVDYDQDHQDKINQLLKRCEMESSLAKSSKGFTIERKPAYVIQG